MVERSRNVSGGDQSGDGTDDVRRTFDWTERGQPSATLVEVLAEARGVGPTEGVPLNEYVDVDALDALFDRRDRQASGAVEFTVDGYRVRVEGRGLVAAWPAENRW